MNTVLKNITGAALLSAGLLSTANAALVSRLGGDALYDDVLDITWLSNANLALTNQFGLSLSTNEFDNTANTVGSTGRMTWDNADAWIAGMNSANHLGFNDWRLPDMDINDDDTIINCTGGGVSGCSDNEYGHLFWETGITAASPGTAPNNFTNLQSNSYWSGVELDSSNAWFFGFVSSFQGFGGKNSLFLGLAVRPGDVAAVPVPAAAWLFGSGLLGLMGVARRKSANKFKRI